MSPEDTDAPASEMLEDGNLLYTAQWKFLCPCHVNAYNCRFLLHMHWNFMKFGQNSANANPSLYAQQHTKATRAVTGVTNTPTHHSDAVCFTFWNNEKGQDGTWLDWTSCMEY